MDFVAAVVADEQSFVLVEPGEGALDDSAVASEPGTVPCPAAGDLGLDAALAKLAAVLVVVVAAVGCDPVGPAAWAAWAADLAAHRRHLVDERDQLGDVIAVAAGDGPGERDPGRVYEKVML